jgi:RHS repeat-associated protein
LEQECNPEGECIQFTYDCVGNRLTETRPNANVITYDYDENDQLIDVTDPIGKVASYEYDCVGNRLTEEDGNNNTTQYEYDGLSRLIKVTDAIGEFTTYEYDSVGRLLRVTDRQGSQTSYTYDRLYRTTTITDALGGETIYVYDCVGNHIRIIDCNGNYTEYEYDPLNRLIKETYADGGVKEFTYDGVGNLIIRKDQNGAITTYDYDDLHRLTERDYPGLNDDTFTYDKGGRMLTANNSYSGITYTYDGVNRVTQNTQDGLAVGYTYDIPNNRRITTYPGGKVVKEEMDKRDRLDTIKDAIDQIIADNAYDLGDRITGRAFINTTDTTWNYNQNNWVTQLGHMRGVTTLVDLEYDHDKEGNRLYAKKNHDTSNSEKYTYDALYRLIDFKRGVLVGDDIPAPSKQCTWTLDCVGNWLRGPVTCPQTGGCAISPNQVNEYTNICGTSQTHDGNGNLTDDGTNTYEYDYENRLTKVTRKSDSVVLGEYRYDALSRRVEKEISGTITTFVYDGSRVIEERQGGPVVAEYVFGSGIDEVLTMDRGGSTYYYHANSLGSIVALTDSAGNIVEHYRYDAYGKPEIYVGPGADATWFTADDVIAANSGAGNSYLFTGRRLDEETGLYYYRARFYSPERGRFLQRDPLGYVDGMNLYEYTKSRPKIAQTCGA